MKALGEVCRLNMFRIILFVGPGTLLFPQDLVFLLCLIKLIDRSQRTVLATRVLFYCLHAWRPTN